MGAFAALLFLLDTDIPFLDKNAIEERFGLRVALNQAKRSSLRKIKRTSVAENARKTAEQMPFSSPIESFGIDISQDLLDGVTVSGGENLLATGSITGSDSLSLSVDETIATIPAFLERVYGVYELDNYKKEFEWIDRIVSVRSQAKIDALNNEAVELIRRGDPSIWMAVPEVIEWESIAGFKVSGSQGLYDDVCIDDVLCSVDLKTFEYSDLKKLAFRQLARRVTLWLGSGLRQDVCTERLNTREFSTAQIMVSGIGLMPNTSRK